MVVGKPADEDMEIAAHAHSVEAALPYLRLLENFLRFLSQVRAIRFFLIQRCRD